MSPAFASAWSRRCDRYIAMLGTNLKLEYSVLLVAFHVLMSTKMVRKLRIILVPMENMLACGLFFVLWSWRCSLDLREEGESNFAMLLLLVLLLLKLVPCPGEFVTLMSVFVMFVWSFSWMGDCELVLECKSLWAATGDVRFMAKQCKQNWEMEAIPAKSGEEERYKWMRVSGEKI